MCPGQNVTCPHMHSSGSEWTMDILANWEEGGRHKLISHSHFNSMVIGSWLFCVFPILLSFTTLLQWLWFGFFTAAFFRVLLCTIFYHDAWSVYIQTCVCGFVGTEDEKKILRELNVHFVFSIGTIGNGFSDINRFYTVGFACIGSIAFFLFIFTSIHDIPKSMHHRIAYFLFVDTTTLTIANIGTMSKIIKYTKP